MNLIPISNLFSFEKGSLQSTKCVSGKYDFLTASAEWKTHNEYTHDIEALVFAAAASGSLGRTHYVNGKFIASDLCFVISPKDPINFPIDLQFYHIIFNEFKEDIVKNTKRGTSKEAIGLASFGNYELPYFDIDKQIEIKNLFVASKKTKDNLSLEQSHQLDLLKKLRQQILQDAVQGKLVPQDPNDEPASRLLERIRAEKEELIREKKIRRDKPLPKIKPEEIPFEIHEGWVWCRLSDVCSKIGSGSTPKGSNYSAKGVPFFRSQNVHDNGLVYDDIKFINGEVQQQMSGTIVKSLDLLLNITGGSLGRCANVPENFTEGNVSQHVCIIRPISQNNNFFHNVVLSLYFQKMIFESTTGAGREGLPKYNLEKFIISIPPLQEQHRIVSKIEQLMKLFNELAQSIQQNQKYTQELLQVALKEALEPDPVRLI